MQKYLLFIYLDKNDVFISIFLVKGVQDDISPKTDCITLYNDGKPSGSADNLAPGSSQLFIIDRRTVWRRIQ